MLYVHICIQNIMTLTNYGTIEGMVHNVYMRDLFTLIKI